MTDPRKRYLIASALFEYILNEEGKPIELRRDNDVAEMIDILNTEYAGLLDTLAARKQMSHERMRQLLTVVEDSDDHG